MKLGQKIKSLRKNKDIPQKKLASDLQVGQATISQWESNRQEPNPAQRAKLCKYFGITEADLFGNEFNNVDSTLAKIRNIPLISWVKANHFEDIADFSSPGLSDEWVQTTTRGDNMFALKVVGDCMTPEFNEGDIIIVKPNVAINNGDFVIVKDTKSEKATFKQYKVYGKKIILHPLNPKYQDIDLEDDEKYRIIGRVVEKIKKY